MVDWNRVRDVMRQESFVRMVVGVFLVFYSGFNLPLATSWLQVLYAAAALLAGLIILPIRRGKM